MMTQAGYGVFPAGSKSLAWTAAAYRVARGVVQNAPNDLRHGKTWRVGVDALPNAPDGSIDGEPLSGEWQRHIQTPAVWHRAQLSVVYPGYPRQDRDESETAHRYRLTRDAAHVDGLLPEGPARRRHLREPHAFILGLALNAPTGSPLVVWPGSHLIVQSAFARAFTGVPPQDWGAVDVTDIYQAARRRAFDICARITVPLQPGEAVLLHRHLVHGVAPWGSDAGPAEGRMIAYFRPQLDDPGDWLAL